MGFPGPRLHRNLVNNQLVSSFEYTAPPPQLKMDVNYFHVSKEMSFLNHYNIGSNWNTRQNFRGTYQKNHLASKNLELL